MLRSLGEIKGVQLLRAVKAETDRHIQYIGLIVEKTT
jgi:hypothetical protein